MAPAAAGVLFLEFADDNRYMLFHQRNPMPAAARSVFIALAIALSAITSGSAFALLEESTPARTPNAEDKLQEGYRALASKDMGAAEAAFKESSRLDPKAPAPILGLAEVAKLQGNAKGVESWLKQALKIAPQSADVHIAWGRYLSAMRNFPDAEAAFKKARQIDPKLLATHLDLGELYLGGLFKPKEAELSFREATRLRPDHAGAHNGLASTLVAQKRLTEAAVEFENAARLAPDNPLPLHSLGRMYQYTGETKKALDAYGRALKVTPGFTAALLDRGDLYATNNQPDLALADYTEALKRSPKSPVAHFRLGMFYHGRNQGAEAAAEYRATIEADPRYAPAYNNLAALATEEKGNMSEALSWAKKAVELQPGVPEFIDTLGQVHHAHGNIDLAIQQFRRAANSKPPRAEYYYHLGRALAEKGTHKDAKVALQRALQINKDFKDAVDAKSLIEKIGT